MPRRAFLLFLTVGFGAGPAWAQEDGPDEPVVPPVVEQADVASGQSVDLAALVHDLVAGLGSSDFDEREKASEQLLALGPKAYGALAGAYRRATDYEVRLRIQAVVTRCFFRENLFGRNGFLGVGLSVLARADDDRIPDGHCGVEVARVVDDSAADRAGLMDRDLIVAIDGQPLPADLVPDDFSRMIREAGPRATMRLTVMRGRKPRFIDVTLGARPLEYYSDPRHLRMFEQTTLDFERWWKEEFAPGSGPPTDHPSTAPFPQPTASEPGSGMNPERD